MDVHYSTIVVPSHATNPQAEFPLSLISDLLFMRREMQVAHFGLTDCGQSMMEPLLQTMVNSVQCVDDSGR